MPLLIVMQMQKFSVVRKLKPCWKMLKCQLRALYLPKRKKKKKKPSKPTESAAEKAKGPRKTTKVACALCNGLYANMRQHLSKAHQNLTDCQRKFLISFYMTSICSSTVYQCKTCLIRFTGKGKHLKLCKKPANVRVKAACTNNFPESLKDASIWKANSGTGKATSLLEEYKSNQNHQKNFNGTWLREVAIEALRPFSMNIERRCERKWL